MGLGEAVRTGRGLRTGWVGRTGHFLREEQEHRAGEEV